MKIANAIFLLVTLSSAAAYEAPFLRASALIGNVAADDVDDQKDVIANEADADEIENYNVPQDFLIFARREVDDCRELLCDASEEACQANALLINNGMKFKALPDYVYLNYLALAVAYPLFSVAQMAPSNEVFALFLRTLRLHRALGLGNGMRFQGYNDAQVNLLYWNNYHRLETEDDHPPMGDGIGTYCSYIAQEYQELKDFAKQNYDGENVFLSAATFTTDWMSPFCSGFGETSDFAEFISYATRNDWEHHRSEVVGAMMNTNYTKAVVLHTIWHWESLFSGVAAPDEVIPQFFQSFDVLLS